MTTIIMALFFAQLFVASTVIGSGFPSSNSLSGSSSRHDRHEVFRHEIAAGFYSTDNKGRLHANRPMSSPLPPPNKQEKALGDHVATMDDGPKKFFADRFIHPAKLKHGHDKHGVVHVTVPVGDSWGLLADDATRKPSHSGHLYQPVPSKSKFHWAKPMTTLEFDAISTTPSTPASTTPPTTTTPAINKPAAPPSGQHAPSWLVDDWEDDDESGEKTTTTEPTPPMPVKTDPPPPLPQTLPPVIVPPVSYDIHDTKTVHIGANLPSYAIFDIPTGIATDVPKNQTMPLTTSQLPPLPDHRVHVGNTFNFPNSNMKLLNLDTETKQPELFPVFPTVGSDGLVKPDDFSAKQHELPYFHSGKTEYLKMRHTFPTVEQVETTALKQEVLPPIASEDELPLLSPTLQAAPGDGDTFVLKIPEEPTPVGANLVPIVTAGRNKFHLNQLEPVVIKPEPAKPAHFQTTSAPYLRTESPFRRPPAPPVDLDATSTTPPPPIIDEGDTAVGWSAWTLKVGCSRSCGMGIEIYERFCQTPAICSNRTTTRYKACAQYICPTPPDSTKKQPEEDQATSATYSALAYSSRHRQCAKFNSQPFDGLFYEWTPYYTTTGQCELFCLAKSANFYHKFGEQVEDGTACDPYSESSICIKGKCHPVGCDGVVGSQLKRDRCGVCGGFNESCNTFDGLVLSGDFTLGYHDIIRLPAGATNVFIHEMAPSINNLALHLESGEYVLNGDYHIGLSKKVFAGNVLFVYVHNDKQEESLFAEGPLTESVVVAMLYQSDHVNIHYEYSLPKPGYQPRTPAYAHGPTVTPSTLAVETPSTIHHHLLMKQNNKTPPPPPPLPMMPMTAGIVAAASTMAPVVVPVVATMKSTQQPSIGVPMMKKAPTYTWLGGAWSACSVTCGSGNRLRVVTCVDSSTGNVVSDDLCPAASRLETVENCRMDTCTVRWKVGNWSDCSKKCGPGNGVQRRPVECVEFASPDMQTVANEFCERLGQPKPPSESMCKPSAKDCPQWTVGEWSTCQTICGDGNQTRAVTCTLPGNATGECDDATKPAIWQKCQGRPCALMVDWIVSAWSSCVDSCGGGVSTRKVRCATPRGQTQPSTFCRFKPRPSHLRKCQPNENLCRPRWTTGTWSNCSSICGIGVQTRSVICVHLQQEIPYALEDEYCHEARPESEQVCNGTLCGFTWFIGPWTACSATCGTGHRTRTVLCLDGEGKQLEAKQCPAESKPHYRQKCEGAIKHCSLKQQQEILANGPASTSVGMSSLQQKAMPPSDCSMEDYGCCPDGITAAIGPFNAGCPNVTCAESKFGCCLNSMLLAQGPNGEGCSPSAALMAECAEAMFGCCPDGLTPAKGLDLRGCDGLCHDTRFGCCPDNVHPAAGVNFENCPGLNCTESQFGCCPDGIRPAPAPDGKGCPEDTASPTTSNNNEAFLQRMTTVASSVGDILLKITPEEEEEFTTTTTQQITSTTTIAEETTTEEEEDVEETTQPETTTMPSTTIEEEEFEETTTEEPLTTTTEDYEETSSAELTTTEAEPTTITTTEEITTATSTSKPTTTTTTTTTTTEPALTCDDSEFGCCPDGETSARGSNMEGCPTTANSDCATSPHGCCEDGVTAALGPDLEGCPENDEESDDEVVDGEVGSGDETEEELIPTRVIPTKSTAVVIDSSLETSYIPSSSGFSSIPGDDFLTTLPENDKSVEITSSTTEPPPKIHIDLKSEVNTQATIDVQKCKDTRYGCCPDGKTAAQGPNLDGCWVNCSQPYESGDCENHELLWYFDPIHGVCARFWYSGCGGNTNRFATEEHCKTKCIQPLSGLERCLLPPIRGPCNRLSEKDWHHFDTNTMSCQPFEFGGCNGNNNRFESKKECEDGCLENVKRDVCRLPPQSGDCQASIRRWFFNTVANRCEIFTYSGCNGNFNRFTTAERCHSFCGGDKPIIVRGHQGRTNLSPVDAIKALARSAKTTLNPRCLEKKEGGPCKAHMKRWFYDIEAATCRQFVYGGCRGNGNNFASADECHKNCGGHKVDEKPKPVPMRAKHPACLLSPDPGPCTDHVKRYHYDASTMSCNGFWFGGCGGNQNNFPDADHCLSVCKPEEVVEIIYDTEEIDNNDEEEDEEEEDDYIDNDIVALQPPASSKQPPSKIIQESVATKTVVTANSEDDPLDCLEDFSFGDCSDNVEVWAFDVKTNQCVRHNYSGCGGTANRFTTHQICHQTCIQSQRGTLVMMATTKKADVIEVTGSGSYAIEESTSADLITPTVVVDNCNLPREVGTCSKSLLRWFYDAASDSCRPFFYTGCKGNANNYENEADCLQRCLKDSTGEKMKQLREVDDCFQLPDQGPCDGQLLRWYFDFEHDRRCKTFYYGGCGGSRNNFVAHDDCTAFCSQAKCQSLNKCALASTPGACPFGLLVDANGCELCQCHDPCQRTKCGVSEICRVERQNDGKFAAVCEPEPESESCSESQYGCCPDGVTLSQRADHADCPEMPPEITTSGPTYIEAAVGETVTLLCRARGSPTPEIMWYRNWNHISLVPALASRAKKQHDGSLQIVDLKPNDTANYTCRAHNRIDHDESAESMAGTRNYQLVVRVPAKITSRTDSSVVAKLGSSVVIPCLAEGNPQPEIRWHFGEKLIKSDIPDVQQTPEGLKISPVETRHIGSYRCSAENTNGQDQRVIRLDLEASLRVKILSHNATYQVGSELTLTCEGSGFPRPRLRWQKNGGHLKHATIVEQISEGGAIARLTIDAVQVSDSGNYICTAANGQQEERQQTAIRVKQTEDEQPSNCVDKPQFANCGLIVAARLCGHHSFAKFCCESCYKAGQLRQKLAAH